MLLEHVIGVRIPVPEQYKKEQINLFFFVLFAKQRGIRTGWKRVLSEVGRPSEKRSVERYAGGISDANPGQVSLAHSGARRAR